MATNESHVRYLKTLVQLSKQCATIESLIGNPEFRQYNRDSTLQLDAEGTMLRALTEDLTARIEDECTKIALSFNNADVAVLGQAAADRMIKERLPLLVSFIKTLPTSAGETFLDAYLALTRDLLSRLAALFTSVAESFALTVRGRTLPKDLQQRTLSNAQLSWDACKALHGGPRNNLQAVRRKWVLDITPLVADAARELGETLAEGSGGEADGSEENAGKDSKAGEKQEDGDGDEQEEKEEEDDDDGISDGTADWSVEKRELAQEVLNYTQLITEFYMVVDKACLRRSQNQNAELVAWLDALVPQGQALSGDVDEVVCAVWEEDEVDNIRPFLNTLQEHARQMASTVRPRMDPQAPELTVLERLAAKA
ncbi:hypothetical protein IWQ60_005431 [Tieghemiomyces parasiticus]|uniref:Cyclin-D1-binding protein 1-like N-terminal domain-containing protein n=1 Tax=Tieghemiomyces parasiticus TaxID=78921 RepID=A0A9W8DYG8_9FUNG|nr:hypothetical protein IWQ60_005431 [Tieghemiomyces parasiticus]